MEQMSLINYLHEWVNGGTLCGDIAEIKGTVIFADFDFLRMDAKLEQLICEHA
ncbi:hypothetical protein D3C71_2090990 [compost metagenome]